MPPTLGENLQQALQAAGSGRAMAVKHEFRSEVPWPEGDHDAQVGGRATLQYAMVTGGFVWD